ncbi:MAG: methyl-accepting chemotaxis protein [Nitrospinota bacterium]|nr:methyl-accepting chemotaxis protein [Nitrospinota bacterium]
MGIDIRLKQFVQNRYFSDLSGMIAAQQETISRLETRIYGKERQLAEAEGKSRNMERFQGTMEQYMIGIQETMRQIVDTSVEQIRNVDLMSDNFNSLIGDIERVTSSITEMHDSFGQVVEGAKMVVEMAKESSERCDAGEGGMDAASKAMDRLKSSVGEITGILEQIKKIAASTNLLALNAVIEAASAGEAGRGFSVVAAEVKNLAKESALRAEEIRGKVMNLEQATKDVYRMVKSSTDGPSKEGADLESAVEIFAHLGRAAHSTSRYSQKILTEMEEQIFISRGVVDYIGELGKSVNKVGEKTGRFVVEAVSLGSMARSALLMFKEIDKREKSAADLLEEAKFGHRSWMIIVRGWLLDPATVYEPRKIVSHDKCAIASLRSHPKLASVSFDSIDSPNGAHRALHTQVVEIARLLEPIKQNPSMPEEAKAEKLSEGQKMYKRLWLYSDQTVRFLNALAEERMDLD